MRLHHLWAAVIVVVVSALASSGQLPPDPATTLQATQDRLLGDLARLPRYTCVQTITRRYYRPQFQVQQPPCASLIAVHEKRTREMPAQGWDRLRLEVGFADGQNIYSWVGAPSFEKGIEKLAGRGPLWSGDFGPTLESIFRRAEVNFQKEEVVNGRRLLEYSYNMPIERSGYQVKASEGWVTTAYSGTFLLDPNTADIVTVTVRTAELPEGNPACQAISEVDYARTPIHDLMVLIPSETRLRTINREGSETFNRTTYANCREYASTSRMLFSDPQSRTGTSVAQPQRPPPGPIPAGVHFDCRMVTPIDSDTASAGDPLEAVLRSPIRDKKNSVLIPAGTRLHGRLLEIGQRSEWGIHFQIIVQFEDIEVNGRTVPFRAVPKLSQWARGSWMQSRLDAMAVSPEDPSAEAGTFIFYRDHLRLQRFDWQWITLSPDNNGKKVGNDTRQKYPRFIPSRLRPTLPCGPACNLVSGTGSRSESRCHGWHTA